MEAVWDATNDRYQVTNINDSALLEAASGTDTELLLTAAAGTAVAANPAGTDGSDLTRIAIGGTNYNIPGGSGGVSIGGAIGTHRMVNSYTTSRMYATTVPTPAATAGDLLMVTYSPDASSPDNAIAGSEVAFVPLANVLAIPNAYSGSSSADAEGSDRDSLRTGWGQNDWLYLGVTALVGGNLTIGSTDGKYAGTFTFRLLSFGTVASGQESPGTEGVAELTAGLALATFYAYATSAKDAPTSSWRFDDEWSGDAPGTEGWYTSEAAALEAAPA